jgi:hypothetical protein
MDNIKRNKFYLMSNEFQYAFVNFLRNLQSCQNVLLYVNEIKKHYKT